MPATRRLAAILAADVAGYSRLIGADEQGTLARLKAIRTELTDPAVAGHNGRIVKTTGDGLLAEFASTVDALLCAQEIQAIESGAHGPDRRTGAPIARSNRGDDVENSQNTHPNPSRIESVL